MKQNKLLEIIIAFNSVFVFENKNVKSKMRFEIKSKKRLPNSFPNILL